MGFSYNENKYNLPITLISLVSTVSVIFMIQISYPKIAFLVGIIGLGLALILNYYAKYRSRFIFCIQEKCIQVIFKEEKQCKFNWNEIVAVKEDKKGLIFVLNDEQEFPIMNDLRNYSELKNQILIKTHQYQIPFKSN